MNKPCTHEIVQEAMRIVSKDVIAPKYVRNMSKIPTAEEFWKKESGSVKSPYQIMKEFAKLHVQAALKEASKCKPIYNKPGFPGNSRIVIYNVDKLKQSIINAYDLNNIK
jgi:hypothetical protein